MMPVATLSLLPILFISGIHSFAFPFGPVFDLFTNKLEWKTSDNGDVPGDAIKLYPFSNTAHHFCRVVQNGQSSYGFLTTGQTQCKYADLGTDTIQTSGNYDVLTGDDSGVALRWVGSRQTADDLKNKNVVSCNLDFNNTSDCYLGAGVYSDGICEEDLGVIVPSRRRVLMPSRQPGGKLSVCGVYVALVQK